MVRSIPYILLRALGLAGLLFALVPTLASAIDVKWTLSNASFDDGGTLSGYFVYNSDTGVIGERAISVAGGDTATFPVLIYNNADSRVTYSPFGNPQPTLVTELNNSNRQLRLTPDAALTNAGGRVALNLATAAAGSGGAECYNCGPARRIVAGSLFGQAVGGQFVITPALAGNWYDPAQDGHGFQFEVLPNNVATAFWFTFDNAGNQVWINAAGAIDGNRIVMNGGRVLNGRFPPNFDPSILERRSWGTLTFLFTDCNHGTVTWTSTDPAFTPSGSMTLTRLTSLSGLACP
ncbi:MAG: hypothetical protein ABI411_16020 [Tahibacter sp.]